MSLSSATSDEMAGVEEFEFTLATTALARDCRTFDLLSMISSNQRAFYPKNCHPQQSSMNSDRLRSRNCRMYRVAMMTGNFLSPYRNAYSRWGGRVSMEEVVETIGSSEGVGLPLA
nr:hypothetical protein [Tanacetum cinerariifolium]